jgi:hypothetical protein
MPRTLSCARLKVPPDRQVVYLAAIKDLATIAARRGQHIWVFRSQSDPDSFLEFSESPTVMSHRNVASRTPDELRLEHRLQQVAGYQHDAAELWEEVPLDIEVSG